MVPPAVHLVGPRMAGDIQLRPESAVLVGQVDVELNCLNCYVPALLLWLVHEFGFSFYTFELKYSPVRLQSPMSNSALKTVHGLPL